MEKTKTLTKAQYVGVDVSKARLDYTVDGETCRQVPNTEQGVEKLCAWCHSASGSRVVCEATGGYERRLVEALIRQGIEVSVVMPARVRAFAKAEGLLAKTGLLPASTLRRAHATAVARSHDARGAKFA